MCSQDALSLGLSAERRGISSALRNVVQAWASLAPRLPGTGLSLSLPVLLSLPAPQLLGTGLSPSGLSLSRSLSLPPGLSLSLSLGLSRSLSLPPALSLSLSLSRSLSLPPGLSLSVSRSLSLPPGLSFGLTLAAEPAGRDRKPGCVLGGSSRHRLSFPRLSVSLVTGRAPAAFT